MEASQEASASFGNRSHCDEVRWVMHVKRTLETMNEEDYSRGPVSIFGVPKSFLSVKPEAYIPQIVALGPYHHWDRQLYQMEHYKLAATKRIQNQLQLHGFTFQQIVDYCVLKEHAIRSCYHRHIDLHVDTLAWMMAIDASFLLEFLRNFSCEKGPSMSQMTDLMGIKMACNSILRDVVMLENQIPLFLIRKMLCFQRSSSQAAEDELSMMLVRFLKAVSPFTATQSLARIVQVKRYAHLLQLLYCIIVANAKDMCSSSNNNNEIECVIDAPESNNEQNKVDSQYSTQLFDSVWSSASALHIMNLLIVKPIEFLLKVPWPVVTAVFRGVRRSYSPIPCEPLLAEEIEIPSVTELIKSGVKFAATEGDLRTIEFDTKTATFYLPTMLFDANSEVVLRNLVAYETAAEPGPLVFTRYTELVNGIIDTKEDVRLLRRSGVVLHRMKNDEDVAKLWNGMSRSARPTKVDFLDKVISDVNGYYNSRWSVRARRFIKNYVTGSWQVLTFLAAILLLLLTCVDAFCSVFLCSSLWSSLV
ncbi:putative UPF0481 protein At3g02645 [Musa acuminata AAA Group]|uniref:putative UPF0481 protein At3g02645 n=1 Tax=Musa acuminata AAA Group TaxID=214697 RepID=UPI0031DFA104